jgi:PAS domain S-box-containing protein/diguanylate cyclase (GGDEF)-like protein
MPANQPLRVLIVEDRTEDAELMLRALQQSGFHLDWKRVDTEEDYLLALAGKPDVVLADHAMPNFGGMRALALLKERTPDIPLIIVSGTIGEELAVKTMRHGAVDYLLKDRLARLGEATRQALEKRRLAEAAKQAEAALRASEERFRILVEYSADAVSMMNANGTVLYRSPAASRILGYSMDELLGRSAFELVHPDDLSQARQLFGHLLKQPEKVVSGQLRYRRKDDTWCWLEGIGRNLLAKPEVAAIVVNYRDVTEQRESQDALKASEERFRAAFEQAGVGMALRGVDPLNLRWLRVNRKLCEIFGYDDEELLRLTLLDVTPDDERDVALGYDEKLLRGELSSYTRERRYVRKDGRIIWGNISVTVLHSPDGCPTQVLSVIEDITERKRAEEHIQRLNRIYAVLSNLNSLIVRQRDRRELCNEACRIAVEHGRFAMAWIGMLDRATLDVMPVAWAGDDAEPFARMHATARADVPAGQGVMGRAIREGRPVFSNDIVAEQRVSGPRRAEALRRGYRSLIALPLLAGGEVVGNFSIYAREAGFFNEGELKLLDELAGDISFALENIAKQAQLDYLAYYDPLTGLPNRALFHERLSRQLRDAGQKGTKVAVLVTDVKRFRPVNEALGRHAGDTLLREIAARARRLWPDPHNLAHIVADCFAGFLPDIKDETEIAHFLEKLVTDELASPFKLLGQELSVSIRTGIAVFPADGADAETLFTNAEAALKRAKKSGETYLFYQPAMNAAVSDTLLLENKLRRALEKDEFVLHYQPKIDLVSGRISGLEALMRWNDPETGLVPPAQFIPLLEETGMILEAGRWAIRQAMVHYRGWHAQGLHPPRIAVNVSPIQLQQKHFVEVIRDVIEASMPALHGLDLEITESVLMENVSDNVAKLRTLREMGVSIAIDDFGTGYSSLGYLAKLPVNALKIDRSFIVRMVDDPDSMSIVSTIISLAHSLSLKVIAEGVDSGEQQKVLRLLRCDEIQGYLVSKPLPAADVVIMLQEQTGHHSQ